MQKSLKYIFIALGIGLMIGAAYGYADAKKIAKEATILFATGLIFSAIGALIASFSYRRKKTIARLQQSGEKIITHFKEIKINKKFTVNNRHPYQIISAGQYQGTDRKFKSDYLWFDPTIYVSADKDIIVLLDQQNPKNYYLDLSFLPADLQKKIGV